MEQKSIELKLEEAKEHLEKTDKIFRKAKADRDFWLNKVWLYEEKLRHQKQGQLEIGGVE